MGKADAWPFGRPGDVARLAVEGEDARFLSGLVALEDDRLAEEDRAGGEGDVELEQVGQDAAMPCSMIASGPVADDSR